MNPLDSQSAVDSQNPWLGLASYSEETRVYFHGREEEIAELGRRIQRKLLTVLFGQSGLGKTSILRAGIVPRLRPAGYCPVYVRIDYLPESPSPAEQIKQAIFRATQATGEWTQPGTAVAGESLWEFLHHRDDVLRDQSGKAIVPLLIFDQFEEIFTLAQSDAAGRSRAAQFLEELADLVENRPPGALEAKLEHDDASAERFDFARADYRILIALREDYLAHLESLKAIMPSITQNRLRLARMTGEQALSAVEKPGGKLVSREVAESIVRFVAGGAELRNAEVEPSLLSLICRELNNARIVQGRAEISADLLAGSHDTILSEFYARALADQPPAVRHFIEDAMLTESGFRESLAEERVLKGFAAAGAAPDALAKLVDRRLLRVEDRLDVRRVELTHDVLCNVVRANRDSRHEREARDAAERQLAAQREREVATRKALVRARQVAAACAVLAIFAIVGAVFGYLSTKRAQDAEAKAQQTRAMAESARGESEKLIVYLLDDFYRELEPIGRLGIVGDLAKRAIDYYRELPPELRTPQTERNRALALARYGEVLSRQGKLDEAGVSLSEASKVLSELRSQGDISEAAIEGLARVRNSLAGLAAGRRKWPEAIRAAEESLEILKPLSSAANPSRAVLLTQADILVDLGWMQNDYGVDGAIAVLQQAQGIYKKLGALDLADIASSMGYARAGVWLGERLQDEAREKEAKTVLEESVALANRIVEVRPGHMQALRSKANALSTLAEIELRNLRISRGLAMVVEGERTWETLLKLDPSSNGAWNNLAVDRSVSADLLFRLGRIDLSIQKRRDVVALADKMRVDSFQARNLAYWNAQLALAEANFGRSRESAAALAVARQFQSQAYSRPLDPSEFSVSEEFLKWDYGRVLIANGDYKEGLSRAKEALPRIDAIRSKGDIQNVWKRHAQEGAFWQIAICANELTDYAVAETAARRAIDVASTIKRINLDDERWNFRHRMQLAFAVARQGRLKEADAIMQPVLKFHRALAARRHDDLTQYVELSNALFISALAEPAEKAALLAEAASILDGLPSEMQRWKETARLRAKIAAEQPVQQ